ncbi:MAG: phosphodiester glycosidase family protein [Bacteroidales bacterium]|nr:phosphodiester glycosidase family protein [Bacteroidales bacterium]
MKKYIAIAFVAVGMTFAAFGQGVKDSLAFVNALWSVYNIEKKMEARFATEIPMFGCMQSVSVVVYPYRRYKTEIIESSAEKSDKTSRLSIKNSALAGINGSYFNMKTTTTKTYLKKDKKVWAKTGDNEVFRVDGVVGIKGRKVLIAASDTSHYDIVTAKWNETLAAGPVLITDGKIVVKEHYGDGFFDKRHPRSIIGTDDRGNVYFVVIDGRFPGQGQGATIYETAYICHLLGMTNALNLDGGGSSTLWIDAPISDGVAQSEGAVGSVINHPYDNKKFDHAGERTVPNVIIVRHAIPDRK